jgi:phosphoglycerate dehydrogenase-like enzyme
MSMRIAFHAPAAEFTRQILELLKYKLTDDTLVVWQPDDPTPPEGIEVLVALGPVTRETLRSLPGLVLVQTLSDGYEAVDIEAATELGVWVSYAPADITGNADSVAEFAVLLLLAAVRRVGVAMASIRANARDRQLPVPSLMRKTVCIVGPGKIGAKIAQRLLPFGCRLTAVDRHPLHAPKEMATRPLEELKEAVAEADFVLFCVRATKENTHMIDAGVLAAMKKGGVVVNIARGTLIDEHALYEAVKSGHIRGAGLDVLEHEPMQPDDPLLTLPQILVTPHIAGVTDLMIEGTADYLVEIIGKLKKAEKFTSLLNEPRAPRLALHG